MNPNEQPDPTGKYFKGTHIKEANLRMVNGTCEPVTTVEPGQPFTFDWSLGATETGSTGTGSGSGRFSEPVTFTLQVWQLIVEKDGVSYSRSPQPILSKVSLQDLHFTADRLFDGPCKPPYMCDMIWEVQAISSTGKVLAVHKGGGWNLKAAKKR